MSQGPMLGNPLVGHTARGTVTTLSGCGHQQTLELTGQRTFEETWASILVYSVYARASCCEIG